jgi:hypothetical protein
MLNKYSFRKSVLLFTTLVVVMGGIAVVILAVNVSEAYSNKGQDHKGWIFGPISSIQNNKEGEPAWILSGHWVTNIINKTKDSFNQTTPAKFDSRISMVMLNGSAMHKHTISNFSLSDINSEDNTTSYKGTVTITMKEGPVKEVPIEIKVMDNHVIGLSLDATKTDNHFGDTPIYGIIPTKADIVKMMSQMGNKTKMDMNLKNETSQ